MIEGLLAGLLLASLILNVFLLKVRANERTLLTASEDMRRAAELRSNEQIDRMLERLHTTPSLALDAGRPMVAARSEAPTYIPDTPDADEQWNDYVGEPGEDE